MERMRKPLQGITNIIRFNWHFYFLSLLMVISFFLISQFVIEPYRFFANMLNWSILLITLNSLLVSFYVYDLSGLYNLKWLDDISVTANSKIANINAGFDETSELLQHKFPHSELRVYDFYDPIKHTEISIKRARKAYPPYTKTIEIKTDYLPVADNQLDVIFLILSAHEIRQLSERNIFFRELERALKQNGIIIVTEHTKDLPNFLAFNIGFFHFVSTSSWISVFKNARLEVKKQIKITPFITSYFLTKNGTTA
jgi:SAM-dependent methyltransferase